MPNLKDYILWAGIAAWLGCGSSEPSFEEETTVRAANVTVEESTDDGEASQRTESVTDHAQTLSDDELNDILSQLGDAGSSGSDDATAASSSTSGSSSTDPNNTENNSVSDDSSSYAGGEDSPTKGELNACANLNGVTTDEVSVISGTSDLSVSAGAILAAKVGGDQGVFELNLVGAGSVAALCLFNSGNSGVINITVGVALGNLVYGGRGDQSLGNIQVTAGGSINQILADLNGNDSLLHVWGDGSVPCSSAMIQSKPEYFSCQ